MKDDNRPFPPNDEWIEVFSITDEGKLPLPSGARPVEGIPLDREEMLFRDQHAENMERAVSENTVSAPAIVSLGRMVSSSLVPSEEGINAEGSLSEEAEGLDASQEVECTSSQLISGGEMNNIRGSGRVKFAGDDVMYVHDSGQTPLCEALVSNPELTDTEDCPKSTIGCLQDVSADLMRQVEHLIRRLANVMETSNSLVAAEKAKSSRLEREVEDYPRRLDAAREEGAEEGASCQAILEIQGRERFLEQLRANRKVFVSVAREGEEFPGPAKTELNRDGCSNLLTFRIKPSIVVLVEVPALAIK